MIALWGLATESTWCAVADRLRDLDADLLLLDQALSPQHLDIEFGIESGRVRGQLCVSGAVFDLTSIAAAYFRPYDAEAFRYDEPFADAAREHATRVSQLLWAWADIAPALVVNRPHHMAAGASKPFQARLVRRAGFRTPETVLTNDRDAAERFWREQGRVVFKSTSGVRSTVRCLEPHDLEHLADIETCPVQFQAYVPGTDYRVHTVGSRAYAVRIDSDAVDYRYPPQGSTAPAVNSVHLPQSVEQRCLQLARAHGLVVSGIDLRRTPAGEWYCFEINPSPAFAYFDSDGEVAAAVARLLASPAGVDNHPLGSWNPHTR
jgi:glutathione synthase/RimK-type ligase-like ATP-grasp enzyme